MLFCALGPATCLCRAQACEIGSGEKRSWAWRKGNRHAAAPEDEGHQEGVG